jgi:type-F conjugative transfer system pilin assembly protein TrbC
MKAILILRGMSGDLSSTTKKIAEMVGDQGGVLIDPLLFQRFQVQTVPTFVLPWGPLEKCTVDSCPPVKYIKAQGAVTLRYFLELILRTGEEEERERAKKYLSLSEVGKD